MIINIEDANSNDDYNNEPLLETTTAGGVCGDLTDNEEYKTLSSHLESKDISVISSPHP